MTRKIIQRMVEMCPAAWYIFITLLRLCAILLFFAVVLLIDNSSREAYMTAVSIYETVPALLLIAALVPVCIEDMCT